MKVMCVQENLSKALSVVNRAVATRSSLPVLANVLVATENSMLKLSATNMEISTTVLIGCKVESEGAVTIPARQIGHSELGHLSVGAPADIAVLRMARGEFGFFDCGRAKITGDRKLEPVLTYQHGKLMYDANAITMPRWQDAPPDYWVCR